MSLYIYCDTDIYDDLTKADGITFATRPDPPLTSFTAFVDHRYNIEDVAANITHLCASKGLTYEIHGGDTND